MRRYLHGLDNTPSGAKFAREHHMKAHPDHTTVIGQDRSGYYLDILKPIPKPKVLRFKPQLRMVVNNG